MIAIAPSLPAGAADDGPVSLTLLDEGARFSFRVAPEHRAAAASALELDLPERIGDRSQAGAREALCLGPDEWMIYAPEAEREALAKAFAALEPDRPVSLVDVSERERTIVVEGAAATELLAVSCPLDLSRLAPGRGTRTVFDGVTVVIRREAEDKFVVQAWRSYTPHVWQVLCTANAELAAGL
jgi:sarcosine oxidase subunit gamma